MVTLLSFEAVDGNVLNVLQFVEGKAVAKLANPLTGLELDTSTLHPLFLISSIISQLPSLHAYIKHSPIADSLP